MLDSPGIELGAGISDVAMRTAVECLNREDQRDVSEDLEHDRQEDILHKIESNVDHC